MKNQKNIIMYFYLWFVLVNPGYIIIFMFFNKKENKLFTVIYIIKLSFFEHKQLDLKHVGCQLQVYSVAAIRLFIADY